MLINPEGLKQCFSELTVYVNYPRILLNNRFQLGGLGWSLRFCISNQHPGHADSATMSLVNFDLRNVIVSLPQCRQAHLIIFQAILFYNLLSSLTIENKHTSRSTPKNITTFFLLLTQNSIAEMPRFICLASYRWRVGVFLSAAI